MLVAEVVEAVNRELDSGIPIDNLPRAAVQGYFVDFFLAQQLNGGLSQFVYNSRWDPVVIGALREGLSGMGAKRHLAILEKLEAAVATLGQDLEEYLDGDYFGENEIRDRLNALNDEMAAVGATENLTALNRQFLTTSGALQVSDDAVLDQRHREREAQRIEQIAHTPKPVSFELDEHQIIRRICAAADVRLTSFNGMTLLHDEKEPAAKFFIGTDRGTHYVLFFGERVRLCEYANDRVVREEARNP